MTPEKRGQRCQLDYDAVLRQLREDLATRAAQRGSDVEAEVAEAFEKFATRYRALYMAYLSAESRCISSFITGPSNFPVARAEKRNNIAHKRLDELVEFGKTGHRKLFHICRDRTLDPIRTEDVDAATRLSVKAETIKDGADRMVEVNKRFRVLRKTSASVEDAYALLFEELDEAETKHVRNSMRVWQGAMSQPYMPFEISNARARQKQAEARKVVVERTQATESCEWEGTVARVVDNTEANRVQLFFPGKPDEQTRTNLKRRGFRWAPSEGAWQAYRTYYETLRFAKEIAGVTDERVTA